MNSAGGCGWGEDGVLAVLEHHQRRPTQGLLPRSRPTTCGRGDAGGPGLGGNAARRCGLGGARRAGGGPRCRGRAGPEGRVLWRKQTYRPGELTDAERAVISAGDRARYGAVARDACPDPVPARRDGTAGRGPARPVPRRGLNNTSGGSRSGIDAAVSTGELSGLFGDRGWADYDAAVPGVIGVGDDLPANTDPLPEQVHECAVFADLRGHQPLKDRLPICHGSDVNPGNRQYRPRWGGAGGRAGSLPAVAQIAFSRIGVGEGVVEKFAERAEAGDEPHHLFPGSGAAAAGALSTLPKSRPMGAGDGGGRWRRGWRHGRSPRRGAEHRAADHAHQPR
jgi:hypothetical protein